MRQGHLIRELQRLAWANPLGRAAIPPALIVYPPSATLALSVNA
jgi:hypothetical protein